MCYSGRCRFEYCDGVCMIYDLTRFEEKYGETACIVGGNTDGPESEEYLAKNKERFDAIYEQWFMYKIGLNYV